MLTIHVWPRRLKEFLLTHPLYKSPNFFQRSAAGRQTRRKTSDVLTPPKAKLLDIAYSTAAARPAPVM